MQYGRLFDESGVWVKYNKGVFSILRTDEKLYRGTCRFRAFSITFFVVIDTEIRR
jgi:hypothetical protein